jgi:hypothetical protein
MLGFERRPDSLLEFVGGKKNVFRAFSKGSVSCGENMKIILFRLAIWENYPEKMRYLSESLLPKIES